jgi:hypothetical protein
MQITVTIPDEVVTMAQARGLTPESYVEGLIAQGKPMEMAGGERPQQTLEEFKASLERLAQFSDKIPDLPLEAISRASMYEDHD